MGFIWVLFLKNNTQTDKMKPNENLNIGPVIIIPLPRLLSHNFPKPSFKIIHNPNFCIPGRTLFYMQWVVKYYWKIFRLLYSGFSWYIWYNTLSGRVVTGLRPYHMALKNMVHYTKTWCRNMVHLPKRARMPHKITRKGSLGSLWLVNYLAFCLRISPFPHGKPLYFPPNPLYSRQRCP